MSAPYATRISAGRYSSATRDTFSANSATPISQTAPRAVSRWLPTFETAFWSRSCRLNSRTNSRTKTTDHHNLYAHSADVPLRVRTHWTATCMSATKDGWCVPLKSASGPTPFPNSGNTQRARTILATDRSSRRQRGTMPRSTTLITPSTYCNLSHGV